MLTYEHRMPLPAKRYLLITIRIIRIRIIRIKHLFKRRFLQVNNNISYKAIYRHTIYK